MSRPRHIAAALAELPQASPILRFGDEECQGARYHSPSPLLVEEVQIGASRWVKLCGTCRENLRVYEELKGHFAGEIPWEVRREFGNQLRAIGDVAQ